MSEEDKELELITARKMIEFRRRMLVSEAQKAEKPEKPKVNPAREKLLSRLVDRGDEVLAIAEKAYPERTAEIVENLVKLIEKGTIQDYIRGGELLWIFRRLGLNVRVETTIRVEESGRFVPLSEKLSPDRET